MKIIIKIIMVGMLMICLADEIWQILNLFLLVIILTSDGRLFHILALVKNVIFWNI